MQDYDFRPLRITNSFVHLKNLCWHFPQCVDKFLMTTKHREGDCNLNCGVKLSSALPGKFVPMIIGALHITIALVFFIARSRQDIECRHLHTWKTWKLHVVCKGSYGGMQHTCSHPGESQSLSELTLCHLIVFILSAGVAVSVELTCTDGRRENCMLCERGRMVVWNTLLVSPNCYQSLYYAI